MKVFLITCESTKERLENALNTLNKLSDNIELVTYFDVGSNEFIKRKKELCNNKKSLWKKYVFNRAKYRELRDSEISIFLKHLYCWEEIVNLNNNENFLIVEDDISFINSIEKSTKDFSTMTKLLAENKTRFDMIYIGESCKTNVCKYRRFTKIIYRNKLFYRIMFGFFADSYIINNYSAKKIVSEFQTISSPVDEFLIYISKYLRIYETHSPIFIQDRRYKSKVQIDEKDTSYKVKISDKLNWYRFILKNFLRIILQDNNSFGI